MKIGFLGCGSMGGAIARAVSQVTKDIVLTDRSGRGKALADQLGVAYGSAKEIASLFFPGILIHDSNSEIYRKSGSS